MTLNNEDEEKHSKLIQYRPTVIQQARSRDDSASSPQDVFGDERDHGIEYKTLSWQSVSFLMIAEIVSNGTLSLPSAMAVVGIVPALIVTLFLGIFALYTAKLLIDFKLRHPEVHSMGDAGYILFGPIGREVLSAGTVVFAIFAAGSELLSGQQALSVLSDNGLCAVYLLLIFACATLLVAMPRTLSQLGWLGTFSVFLIIVCGVLAMIGAGVNPVPDRTIRATLPNSFLQAFLAVTNPVFAYAGHFMFFILISEMKHPEDAMKSAWCLQGFTTVYYCVFSALIYAYVGNTVQSPALLSLPPKWAKATFAIGLGNFLFAGALYSHTAAKLVFVRLFRQSRHVYSHTALGWSIWMALCFIAVAVAFVLAAAVPIFSDLIGITAALFAAWYTYGLAGFFWLNDTYYFRGGMKALGQRPFGTTFAVLTILSGPRFEKFKLILTLMKQIQLIVDAYRDHLVGRPFQC